MKLFGSAITTTKIKIGAFICFHTSTFSMKLFYHQFNSMIKLSKFILTKSRDTASPLWINIIFIAEPPQGNSNCPRKNGFFAHPDPTVCDKFYNCIDGEYTELPCTAGLHFDEFTGTCVWPATAGRTGCTERGSTYFYSGWTWIHRPYELFFQFRNFHICNKKKTFRFTRNEFFIFYNIFFYISRFQINWRMVLNVQKKPKSMLMVNVQCIPNMPIPMIAKDFTFAWMDRNQEI